MQFLSQARAMHSVLVKRLYCAVWAVFMGVLSTGCRSPTTSVCPAHTKSFRRNGGEVSYVRDTGYFSGEFSLSLSPSRERMF